jgi:hypothetical protein
MSSTRGNKYTRPAVGAELYQEIQTAGAFLNGSLPPDQEALTNQVVADASDFTTYYETNGDLWQKRNGVWFQFGTAGSGGQVYDIETTKPQDNIDIRPEGSFWYYKPVGSSFIEEIYVCMENDGGGTRWGLLDNFERTFEKKLISNDTGGFYAGFSFTEDIEKSTVPGSATTSYLKKNDYIFPASPPSYTDFNLTSGKDASNRFTRGSEINGGDSFGMMKCLDNTTGACLWTSDMGAGNAYVNMPSGQVAELSQPGSIKTVKFNIAPTPTTLVPDPSGWYVDNWGATSDPNDAVDGVDKGYFFGSFWTNLTTKDVFFCGPDGTGGDIEWRKIYTDRSPAFYNANIYPTIAENLGGNINWFEVNFGGPVVDASDLNNLFILSGTWNTQYVGPDAEFDVFMTLSATTMNANGTYEYGVFKGTVDNDGQNLIKNAFVSLNVGNAGINANPSSSCFARVALENGDVIRFGRRAIGALGTTITPLLLNISIKEVR